MSKFSIIKEFWAFLEIRKKFWLMPILLVLLLLGMFLIFSETSALAPLIYTLF